MGWVGPRKRQPGHFTAQLTPTFSSGTGDFSQAPAPPPGWGNLGPKAPQPSDARTLTELPAMAGWWDRQWWCQVWLLGP